MNKQNTSTEAVLSNNDDMTSFMNPEVPTCR